MITKLIIFIFVFSLLNLIREGFMFYRSYKNEKLEISNWRLLGIGLSISYIITMIVTGFSL